MNCTDVNFTKWCILMLSMFIFTRVMSIEQDGRRRGGRDGYKNIVQLYEDNVDIGQELRYLKYYSKFGQLEIRSLKLIMYLRK